MFCAYMHAAGCGMMGFLGTCMAQQMMWLMLQAMFLCTLVYITVGVCGYTAFKER